MNRHLSVALLALLIVLAGCAGGPSADGPPDARIPDRATTAEQSPSPSKATATPTPVRPDGFPPGVTETRLRNATRLAAAHQTAIREESFAFRQVVSMAVDLPVDGRTLRTSATTVGVVSRNLSTFHLQTTSHESDGNWSETTAREQWANATALYRHTDDGNRARYATIPRQEAMQMEIDSQATGFIVMNDVLGRGDYEVVTTSERDGRTFFTLEATNYTAGDAGNLSRFESTVVVDDRGVVRRLNTTLVASEDADSQLRRMHFEFELTRVGSITVEKPAWVANATAEQNP